MTNKQNDLMRRGFFVIIGQILCGIGVGFFMFPGLGPDPNSVFIEGVGLVLNMTYGQASFVLNGIIALIIFFIDRKFVNFASITILFTVGFVADFTRAILGNLVAIGDSSIPFRFIFTIIGGIILAIGVAIYTNQDLGAGAFDAMSELTAYKTKIEFSKIRRIIDLIVLGIGYLLGGTVGIGTVYLALTTGPIIAFIRRRFLYAK